MGADGVTGAENARGHRRFCERPHKLRESGTVTASTWAPLNIFRRRPREHSIADAAPPDAHRLGSREDRHADLDAREVHDSDARALRGNIALNAVQGSPYSRSPTEHALPSSMPHRSTS
jgi:hypothetical protein